MEKQEEIWKDIVIEKNGMLYDYTGLYQVSNLGKIKDIKRIKILKPYLTKSGYCSVNLSSNGIRSLFYVHRIVATMFIDNPDKLPEVNHIDENKSNNSVSNLEWCDRKYNCNYGTRNERRAYAMKDYKVTEETKRKISETKKGHGTSSETRSKLSDARKGKYVGSDNPNAKAVICLETGCIFSTTKEAGEWCGLLGNSNRSIGMNCKGQRKSAGKHPETCEKLHWMYYDEWLKLQSENN